jgi:hypothetical protein
MLFNIPYSYIVIYVSTVARAGGRATRDRKLAKKIITLFARYDCRNLRRAASRARAVNSNLNARATRPS